MINIEKEYRTLAAYALFYQLREKNVGVFDIIKLFIKIAVMNSNTLSFSLQNIHALISEKIGLDVPVAVLNRVLHSCDFISKLTSSTYCLSQDIPQSERDEYEKSVRDITGHTNDILNLLSEYISIKRGRNLDAGEKIVLQSDLAHFIIKKQGGDGFKPYIQKFIEENQHNPEITQILQEISMGLIVFLGLQEDNIEQGGKVFDSKLTLYLDTEILFNIMGYNGPEYQKLSDDFLAQVRGVKQQQVYKGNRDENAIHLEFFPEVKDEINGFFIQAERLRDHKASQTPNLSCALRYILSKCPTSSDVAILLADFWAGIEKLQIKCITRDVPDSNELKDLSIAIEENISIDDLQSNSENGGRNRVHAATMKEQWRNLDFLDTINKLRGRHKRRPSMERCGYLFVSNTHDVLSKSNAIQKTSPHINYPLALSQFDVTSRLWLKLNRGFGQVNSMESLKIAMQASIALRNNLEKQLDLRYNMAFEELTSGKIDPDVFKARVASLKQLQDEYNRNDPGDCAIIPNDEEIEEFIRNKICIESSLRQKNAEKQTEIDMLKLQHADEKQEIQSKLEAEKRWREEQERINTNNNKIIAQQQVLIEKSRKDRIQKENQQREEEYNENKRQWNNGLQKFIRCKKRRQMTKSVLCIVMAVIIVSGFIVTVKDWSTLQSWICLFASIITTLLACIKFEWWLKGVRYPFCLGFRNRMISEWGKEYIRKNPQPQFIQYTEEDYNREYESDKMDLYK